MLRLVLKRQTPDAYHRPGWIRYPYPPSGVAQHTDNHLNLLIAVRRASAGSGLVTHNSYLFQEISTQTAPSGFNFSRSDDCHRKMEFEMGRLSGVVNAQYLGQTLSGRKNHNEPGKKYDGRWSGVGFQTLKASKIQIQAALDNYKTLPHDYVPHPYIPRAKAPATNTNSMWSRNHAGCSSQARGRNARITKDLDCMLYSDLGGKKYFGSMVRVMSLFN